MDQVLSDAEWQEDLRALTRLSECSPGDIKGYILITLLHDDVVAITTNACCTHHAAADLVDTVMTQMLSDPACSGEH